MTSYEKRVSNQFGCFCTTVLKNELRTIYTERKKEYDNVISLESISKKEQIELSAFDTYFNEENSFVVLDKTVIISNELLAEAMRELSLDQRTTILCTYFLNMTDRAVGKVFGVPSPTICSRRQAAIKRLKKLLNTE